MPKVTLNNPSKIPPYSDGPAFRRGYSAEVSQEVADELASHGLIDVAASEVSDDAPDDDFDASVDSEVSEVTPAEPVKAVGAKLSRPKQAASVAVWREYAESLGLKVTGMAKPEIIGAVDSAS